MRKEEFEMMDLLVCLYRLEPIHRALNEGLCSGCVVVKT